MEPGETVEDIETLSSSPDCQTDTERSTGPLEIYENPDDHTEESANVIIAGDIQNHMNNRQTRHHSPSEDLIDVAKRSGGSRRQHHWKSQSMGGEVQTSPGLQPMQSSLHVQLTDDEEQDDDREKITFSANRELWQRRATSQTHLNPTPPTSVVKSLRSSQQEFREMRQKHTPDLVMDLPLSAQDIDNKSASSSSLSSSDEESTPCVITTQLSQPSRAEAATSPNGGPESPDMSTAAERFAKQNQCTLKKNTKSTAPSVSSSELGNGGKSKDHDQESDDIHHENQTVQESVETNLATSAIVRSASSTQIIGGGGETPTPLRSPLPPRSTPKIVAKFADMHLTGGSQISSFKPQVKVKPTLLRKPVLPFPHPHMSPELARKIEKQAQSTEQAN